MKVLFAAAGTAGHIKPALAVADKLCQYAKDDNQPVKCLFLGSTGIEQDLVADSPYEFLQIPKIPLERELRNWHKNLALPYKLYRVTKQVEQIMTDRKINVIVGFGGYICVPVYLVAIKLGLPIIIHEQNVRVGLANRFGLYLGRNHHIISSGDNKGELKMLFSYSFPETNFKSGQIQSECIGLPIKRSDQSSSADFTGVFQLEQHLTQQLIPSSSTCETVVPKRIKLLIFGGSLGAMSINCAAADAMEELVKIAQITIVTGKGKAKVVQQAYSRLSEVNQQDVEIFEYVDNLSQLIGESDLVVGRAGAGTVHELAQFGTASILVPLPIGNGEQYLNAKFLQNGTRIVVDKDFTSKRLVQEVTQLVNNRVILSEMAKVASSVAKFNADKKLARIVQMYAERQAVAVPTNIHFIGISGAGIAPLATCYGQLEYYTVTGCDSAIDGHSVSHLKNQDILVYTSAVKSNNAELVSAVSNPKIEVQHRSQALSNLLKLHNVPITVAGSHGKSSVTAMIAQILDYHSPDTSSFVIGAYATINNIVTNGGKLGSKWQTIVAEADESDGSFVRYYSQIGVIINIESDHLDHYRSFDNVLNAFRTYANNCNTLITTDEIYNLLDIKHNNPVIVHEYNSSLKLQIPGQHNQMNATLAYQVAQALMLSDTTVRKALETFEGVERRFEIHKIGSHIVVDDYAHHPTEVQALIDAAIEQYDTDNLVLLFQPHLFSRTRNFAQEFAEQLGRVKYSIVTKIYPAREDGQDFPDVTPKTITQYNPTIVAIDDLLQSVRTAIKLSFEIGNKNSPAPILSVGAGPSLIELFHQIYEQSSQNLVDNKPVDIIEEVQ